ncbi:MAG: uracil-DNA glycosylase [Hyphomonadaceae bacterium]|nr:uracil-DNA glycosylase [Hyphomonadaceae bacterium]
METAAPQDAARALLAFWRGAGVDMDEAEAVFSAKAAPATNEARRTPPIAREPFRIDPPAPKAKPKAKLQPADDAVNTARTLAAAAQNLTELRAAVDKFEGCALKATARNTAFADGAENAPILVIGDAPRRDEDEQGKPFVGPAGQMLDRMLVAIGLGRTSNVLISNTIYWRPPGDRDPTPGEAMACLPFAERLIELTQPKLLIIMGKLAANDLLQRDDTVAKLRGRKLQYKREGLAAPVNAMVMLHPAYLLSRPQQKRLAWADLLFAEAWLDDLGVKRAAHP